MTWKNEKYNIVIEKQGIHNGVFCVVAFMPMGHRSGYVGISRKNILWGYHWLDDEVPKYLRTKYDYRVVDFFDVHYGLTYSGEDGYPINSNHNLWWFGFGCSHLGDTTDIDAVKEYGFEDTAFRHDTSGFSTAKSLDYAWNETIKLANQFSEKKWRRKVWIIRFLIELRYAFFRSRA